ncbi:MAG: hypothetical protein SVU32_01020, partial [Candidatus Nanohaloarchaea archaeon]|nr:hypothetical protein [Candidatus Nanohaloarchaea archaeon]
KLINDERERRWAERMVDDIIDGFDGQFETRVTNTSYDEPAFIGRECSEYDLLLLGYPRKANVEEFFQDRVTPIMEQTSIPVMIVEID